MDIVQAVVLGLVQGLTEFLPVSSSAHLIIVPWLMGWRDPGLTFDVALHLGTLVAVLLYFWRDWVRLIGSVVAGFSNRGGVPRRDVSNSDARLAWYILIATIPGSIAGVIGEQQLDTIFHGETPAAQITGILLIGVVLLAMAGLLLLAERTASHALDMSSLSLAQTLVIGAAQALAIIPGVSRSGSTITAGLFMNLKRAEAARFSFLLGTPIILGAGLKQAYDVVKGGGLAADQTLAFLVGFAVAAVSGYMAIAALLRFLQRNSTLPFIVYRVVLGLLLIGLALAGFRR